MWKPACVHATLSPDSSKSRTIIVGDIHGCLDELIDVLAACSHDVTNDRVVLVGDLVNKGPKSAECVRFAREHGFTSVRGNHDDAALFAWERRRSAGGASSSTASMRTRTPLTKPMSHTYATCRTLFTCRPRRRSLCMRVLFPASPLPSRSP